MPGPKTFSSGCRVIMSVALGAVMKELLLTTLTPLDHFFLPWPSRWSRRVALHGTFTSHYPLRLVYPEGRLGELPKEDNPANFTVDILRFTPAGRP